MNDNAGFPRLYAAASLKRLLIGDAHTISVWFSAALCRGLIEAQSMVYQLRPVERFSAALCRGLIEATLCSRKKTCRSPVFRGSMPRPH